MLSFEFLLRLSAILKLDFLKSPGKSGSARPPSGMKLGNWVLGYINENAKRSAESILCYIFTFLSLSLIHVVQVKQIVKAQ